MIYPEEFLRALDRQKNKTIYAKVVSLSFDEQPREVLEGRVTQGSINLENSSIRRSCSLSLIAQDVNLSDYYWGLNTKFKLTVGVENQVDNNYPDIIWFEQGIFILTSFNMSYSTSAYTINLSGKDKMCLLNGEVSGSVSSSVDFGVMEQEYEKGVYKKVKMPVKDVIREMVHSYAGEPFHNIIINDLEQYGLTLQEYRYDKPMFLFREPYNNTYKQAFIDDTVKVSWNNEELTLAELAENKNFVFESLQEDFQADPAENSIVFYPSDSEQEYTIAKIDYGETAGYTEGALVYPDELIANIGESITSILDKIKTFLGDFEYFYNLQGQFVFQKQKNYAQTDWSPIQKDGEGKTYVEDLKASNGFSYIFNDNEFFTSVSNAPQLNNLKNDFTIWGTRKGTTTTKVPIHMRYAIDNKPLLYTTINVDYGYYDDNGNFIKGDDYQAIADYNRINGMSLKGQESVTYISSDEYCYENGIYYCDWRELIYRMALDYNKYCHLNDFQQRIIAANQGLYQSGRTGYEQYYIDMQGFWRQLYNPFENAELLLNEKQKLYNRIESIKMEIQELYGLIETDNIKIEEIENNDDRRNAEESIPYVEGLIEEGYQIIEEVKNDPNMTEDEKAKIIDSYENDWIPKWEQEIEEFQLILQEFSNQIQPWKDDIVEQEKAIEEKEKEIKSYQDEINEINEKNEEFYYWNSDSENIETPLADAEKYGWARAVYEAPELLIFWFDFMETEGELAKYSVPAIGARQKVKNDNGVKAIYYRETPNIIFQNGVVGTGAQTGYKYFNVPSMLSMFSKSAQGKSAKEEIDSLLYAHSYCIESVSITSIPVYYLEPNTRIYISDLDSGIEGEYIVSRISISLTYNGTMNITATKAAQRIL